MREAQLRANYLRDMLWIQALSSTDISFILPLYHIELELVAE